MQRLIRSIAIALVVLWLPLTAHCELEALGAFPTEQSADDGCCSPLTGCTDDACDMIEGESLVSAPLLLKAPVTVWLETDNLHGIRPHLSAAAPPSVPAASDHVVQSLGWTPTWQFARRAAALARAPSARV